MYSNYTTRTVTSSPKINLTKGVIDPTWMIVALVLAIIGGILAYFLFVKSRQEFKGFLLKLQSFCDFKQLFIEDILKITYLISALLITLLSFGMIGSSFLGFVVTLLLGNLSLRIFYELTLMGVMVYRNLVEINRKLK